MTPTASVTALGPRAEETVQRIRQLIEAGHVSMGGRLAPERALAAAFGTSRETVRAALVWLEQNGEVHHRRGRGGGWFSLRPNPNWPVYSWSRLSEGQERPVKRPLGVDLSVPKFLDVQKFTVATQVVFAGMTAARHEVCQGLGIPEGSSVVAIYRVRFADGLPLSWERLFTLPDRFPGLLDLDLSGSLTEIFSNTYGVHVAEVSERIRMRLADEEHVPYLDVSVGQPLFAITRTAYDERRSPIEFSYDLFRADRTELVITSRRQG